MTIKLTHNQRLWLDKIRGGLTSSPPIPAAIIRQLTAKGVIEEFQYRGFVRYRLTEEGWRFY